MYVILKVMFTVNSAVVIYTSYDKSNGASCDSDAVVYCGFSEILFTALAFTDDDFFSKVI